MESEKTSNLDAAGNGKSGSMAEVNPLVTPVCNSSKALIPRLTQAAQGIAGQATSYGSRARRAARTSASCIGFQRRDPDREEPANKYGWTRCPGAYEIGLANKFCFRGKPPL